MSDQYLYRCKECDYSLYTDEAGCECTFSGISYLHRCKNCNSLLKLWQSIHELRRENITVEPPKIWFSSDDFSEVEVFDKCPKCHSTQTPTRWMPKNGCPKCGGMMNIDANAPMIHSD